ncbi:hypothetical protein [Aquabacterium sp. J223]|uniref:hypothetical protein n=1 Tax=Aquabacterium sp. J223 TaxID=2898431 RepID=UPI0021ADB536|nr:hypothetical protein [Aquabacterium sp. J223]UUX95093.1 hypothetical protein LRS07_17910 [Aquabacterium sp. J223]
MRLPFSRLDGPLFVAAVFAVLVLSRLLALALPTDFYFTFQSLFSDREPRHMLLSLFGKMAAPFLCGLLAGVLCLARWRRLHGAQAGPRSAFARRVRTVWAPTLFAAGVLAAFLSAWPAMVYWDLMANPEVAHLKPAFFVLYAIYMLSFGYVSLLGLLTAIFLREHVGGADAGEGSVSRRELSRVGALWLLNSGLASAAMKLLTGA